MPSHDMLAHDAAAPQGAAADSVGFHHIAALAPAADGPPAPHVAPADMAHDAPTASIPTIHVTLQPIVDLAYAVSLQAAPLPALDPGLASSDYPPDSLLPMMLRLIPEDHGLLLASPAASANPAASASPAAAHGASLSSTQTSSDSGLSIVCSGTDIITLGVGGSVDTITVSIGGDTIALGAPIGGGDGNDNITLAGAVAQTLTDGNGNDTITDLGSGNDSISLGSGNDVVSLGTGHETVTTGAPAGFDLFVVSDPAHFNAADSINGGTGADRIYFADTTSGDTLVLNNQITAGSLSIWAADASGSTSHSYDLGIDAHELTLAVTIEGNQGSDTLVAGTGADTIVSNSTVAGGSEIILNGGGDSIVSSGHADNLVFAAATDSFSQAAAAADGHTAVVAGFNDAAATIDFTSLAGAGTEHFTGLKTGSTFAAAFAGGAANDVAFAVIGGNTFIDVHHAAGYSASDLVIELQGSHTLTAANFHLHA